MGRHHKNNHYHYAEKYTDRKEKRPSARSFIAASPIIFAMLVLFAFGCISTTFSVFVTSPDSSITTGNGLRIAVRTRQVDNPLADTSAVADDEVNSPVLVDENGETIAAEPETEPIDSVDAVVVPATESPEKRILTARHNAELAQQGANSDLAESGYYWDNGTWKLKSDIDWETGLTMTNNPSNDDQAYKDIYLFGSSSNSNFYFKFKEEDGSGNDSWFGPSSGSDTACGTSGTAGGEGKGGNYYINRKTLGTTSTTVYKVRIWFEHAGWVGAWYAKSATYNSLAPTLTAPSTGDVGTAITLSGSYTTANRVGTVTGTYQYSTDDGTTWSNLSSGSYTASAAGTVKFRYKVQDGGVVAGTNSTADRIEYSSVKSCEFTSSNPVVDSVALAADKSSNIYTNETSVTYTATVTGSHVSSKTYTYTVSKDGSVVNTYNQTSTSTTNSKALTFTTAGTYEVSVTVSATNYDSVTSNVVSTTVKDRPAVSLVGGFRPNGWTGGGTNLMTYNVTDACWYVEQDLNSGYSYPQNGDWGFGISINRAGTTTFYNNSGTMASDNCTNWHFETGKQNCGITATLTGTYIFKVTLANDNADPYVSVLYPHEVSFNANGHGTAPSSQVVKHGGYATEPTALSATGYTFGGWRLDENDENYVDSPFAFTTTPITSTFTLYAKWTAKTTTVTLNQQSGSGGTASVTATYGQAMPSATMPTRTGYTFGGYYTGTGGSGTPYYTASGASARSWDFESATKTLYAKWTATTYYIYLYPDGGTISSGWSWSTTYSRYSKTYNITSSTVTLPTPTRDGYTFDGWFTAASGGTQVNQVANGSTGNKTYYAHWTMESYTIDLYHYDATEISPHASGTQLTSAWKSGKTVVAAQTNATKTQITYSVDTATFALPNESQFTNLPNSGGVECGFIGWYEYDPSTGVYDPTGTAVTSIDLGSTGNKAYIAYWTPKKVVRFFNDVTGAQVGATQYITDGGNASKPSTPSMSGFTYSGVAYYGSSTLTGTSAYQGITEDRDIYFEYTINKPDFTMQLSTAASDHIGTGTGATSSDPYVVRFGATLTGSGTVSTTYQSPQNNNIYYRWKVDDASSYTSWVANNGTNGRSYSSVRDTTKTSSGNNTFKLQVQTSYLSARNNTRKSSSAATLTIYYYVVDSPIESFDFNPVQKIYNASDSNDTPVTSVEGVIASRMPADYKAVIKMFNLTLTLEYDEIAEVTTTQGSGNNFTVSGTDSTLMSRDFSGDIIPEINSSGVKHFTLTITRPDGGSYVVDSYSPAISAAFGTKEKTAQRPLYFNAGSNVISDRLMAFYYDNGVLEYQTAQLVTGNKYRFILPDSVTTVYFGIADKDKEYVIPTDPSSPSTLIAGGYYTAFSGAVTIGEGSQTYVVTTINTETTHAITGSLGYQ